VVDAGCPSVEWEYWTGTAGLVENAENASKCRTNKTVVLKHSDYRLTSCSFHARQAEVCTYRGEWDIVHR